MQQCRFSCLAACQPAVTCAHKEVEVENTPWQPLEEPQVGHLRALIRVAEGRRNTAENEGTQEGQTRNILGWVGNWKGTEDLRQRVGNFHFSQSRFVRRDVAVNQEKQRGTEMGEE